MEKVCPLCNALNQITAECRRCGAKLVDAGKIEDFRGPYSPYTAVDVLQDFNAETQCVHLFYCPNCCYDERIAFELVNI